LKITLYNNIVLAGGTTIMSGFKERFEHEIKRLAKTTARTEINVYADLHRRYATWIGGSMIASFNTFDEMMITRADYTEGPEPKQGLVLKKTIF
jgi:centractin